MDLKKVTSFIEKYIDVIDDNKWNDLFNYAAWEEELEELEFIELIKILDSIGCNTLFSRKELFLNGFEQWYTEADDWTAPEDLLDKNSTCGSFAIDYEMRCELIIQWAKQNPGKIDWHWDVRDHSNFEVLCIEDY